jgi:hypothetical protein
VLRFYAPFVSRKNAVAKASEARLPGLSLAGSWRELANSNHETNPEAAVDEQRILAWHSEVVLCPKTPGWQSLCLAKICYYFRPK